MSYSHSFTLMGDWIPAMDTKILDAQVPCIKLCSICIEPTHIPLYTVHPFKITYDTILNLDCLFYLIQSKCYVTSCYTVLLKEQC
jgi:hypothetical protein